MHLAVLLWSNYNASIVPNHPLSSLWKYSNMKTTVIPNWRGVLFITLCYGRVAQNDWLTNKWINCSTLYLLRNGDQLPWILGLFVCQGFFSFCTFSPEAVLSRQTWSLISAAVRLGTGTTWLRPFTTRTQCIDQVSNTFSLRYYIYIYSRCMILRA